MDVGILVCFADQPLYFHINCIMWNNQTPEGKYCESTVFANAAIVVFGAFCENVRNAST